MSRRHPVVLQHVSDTVPGHTPSCRVPRQVLQEQARGPVHGRRRGRAACRGAPVREPRILRAGLALRGRGLRVGGEHSGGLGVQGPRGFLAGASERSRSIVPRLFARACVCLCEFLQALGMCTYRCSLSHSRLLCLCVLLMRFRVLRSSVFSGEGRDGSVDRSMCYIVLFTSFALKRTKK